MEELDVLQTPSKDVQYFSGKSHEFPVPFNFGNPTFSDYESGAPMNRAQRRRMAKEAKKANKKKR